ncbi:MAG: crossover junction endodeoxyribonuclease RuvC [Actinomycetota bacterium]|nr:crossover junction endodeoxyribonuclease RuvC [Actinomycetota bacterium]
MRVIGIDPGFATTGYGVVERNEGRLTAVAHGALRTPAGAPQAERLAFLQTGIADLLRRYDPEAVSVERLFFNINVRTAMAVGQASGVALATAATNSLPVFEYTPLEVKQAVVGVGNATKQQVGAMVASLLGLARPPAPADAADACAMAICHLTRSRLRAAIDRAAT